MFDSYFSSVIRQNSLSTARPTHERQEGSSYCAVNKCYTPTEFALFGVGAIIMGCMVGVVGISWFKNHFLPDEKQVPSRKQLLTLKYYLSCWQELRSVDHDTMERHHPKILAGNNHCYPDLGAGPRNRQKVRRDRR